MGDYAHMSRIKIISPDEMLKLRFDRWVEAQKRPYAKLMSGFYRTEYLQEIFLDSKFDYSRFEPGSSYCEGIIFTYKSFVYPPNSERDQKTLDKDMMERFAIIDQLKSHVEQLQTLDCPVFIAENLHKCQIDDPDRGIEYLPNIDLNRLKEYIHLGIPTKRQLTVSEPYLFMPFQKPNPSFGHETIGMPPEPRTLPDFEGQVTFLAYLMCKGYVTEADAPRGENPAAPFSAAMFGFAKTRAQELSL